MEDIAKERLKSYPIFIGGVQRSGTSLVRSVVGSHPDIAIFQFDLPLWIKFYPIFKHKKINAKNTELLLSDILQHQKTLQSVIQLDKISLIKKVKEARLKDFADVFHIFLKAYANGSGRKQYGLKTPFNEYFVEDIFKAYPSARFIHVIRNPLDAAVSVMKAKEKWWGGRKNFYRHIHQWERSIKCAERNIEKYRDQYLVLKYEDLVQKPEETIRGICNFLDISFHDAMLKMNNHVGWRGSNSSFDLKDNDPKIYSASIGRYHDQLDPKTIDQYKILLRGSLKKYGYDDGKPLSTGPFIKLRYRLEKILDGIENNMILFVQRSPFYRMLKKFV